MRTRRLFLPVLVATLLASAVLTARPAPRLTRTRQIIQAVGHSFVGEPTRSELFAGGAQVLARLAPGVTVKAGRAGDVTVAKGRKALLFKTADMIADSEVAGALEKAVAFAEPKMPLADVDEAMGVGVVSALADRHSVYIRQFYMERLGYTEGEMLGDVGVEVTTSGDRFVIKSVAPGSSAAQAGVRPLQLLRRVERQNLEGLSLGEVGALLLGTSGTMVELVVEPRGGEALQTFALRRDPPFALQPHVKQLKDALYIVPGPMLGRSAKVVRDALQQHPNPKRGIILDLRGNAGGQVGDATSMADLFVENGQLAQVVSRANRPVQRFDAVAGDPGENVPLVLLIDGRSASAAELVSLVLRERIKARLMGAQTFGKGSVQKLIPIDGGGSLKVTSAMYMTPAGTTVGEGIVPDVVLDPDTCPRRGEEGDLETDPWLAAAYNALPQPKAP